VLLLSLATDVLTFIAHIQAKRPNGIRFEPYESF
jgi:hypothetical protein